MDIYKRKKINKILLIIAGILAIIAIIAVVLYMIVNNGQEEIIYEDKIVGKNYFIEMTINLENKEVKRDEIETTLQEEFEIDEQQESLILSSQEEVKKFFLDSAFEVEFVGQIAHIKNSFQTKKIILEVEQMENKFNADEVIELQDNLYILKYDTQMRTKAAYEYFKNTDWVKNIQTDEIQYTAPIND